MANSEPQKKLFSYFIVMGVDTSQENNITYKNIHEGQISPTFLDVFPPFPENKPPQYLENIKTLGFYDGFKIYDENIKILYHDHLDHSPAEAPKFRTSITEQIYSSVMTDEASNRRYCSTFLFYEKYYLKNDQTYIKKEKASTLMPKTSLQDLLKYPYTMNDHDLIYLPKSITLISPIACFDTQRQILKYLYRHLFNKRYEEQGLREIKIPKKWVEWLENLITKQKGNGDVDELWQEWFSSQGPYPFNVDRHEEEMVVVKESQLKEFYMSAIFSLMDLEDHPHERSIIKMNKEDKEEEFARFRNTGLRVEELPPTDYRYLFQKLSVETIIQVFKSILVERQIIFFSSFPGDIPYVTEAFLGLLSPLKWCCMYVPFLPIFFWEHLHALFPYIVGISSEHKQYISSHVDLTDKVVIDLDADIIYIGDKVPDLPKNADDFINSRLRDLFAQIQMHVSTPHSHEVRSIQVICQSKKGIWAESTLKIRHLFNLFMIMLINNYLPFLTLPEDFDYEKRYTATDVFDSESFFSCLPQDNLAYISAMHDTMMFTNFLVESFELINVDALKNDDVKNNKFLEIENFIEQIKEVYVFHSEIQQETILDSENSNTSLNILHPEIIIKLDGNNAAKTKQTMTRYYNPAKVDLKAYFVKYYYKFLIIEKNLNQSHSVPLQPNKRRGYHSRHTSLASLVAITGDSEGTKTLNKSCQNFVVLDKSKIVDLRKMFNKFVFATRRTHHKSLDLMQLISSNLIKSAPHTERGSGNRENYDKGKNEPQANEELGKKHLNDEQSGFVSRSRKSSTTIHPIETKPEIIKRVIQKLESDDFIFKPNSSRKSTINSRAAYNIQLRLSVQINEADEFALEDLSRKALADNVYKNNGTNQRYAQEG